MNPFAGAVVKVVGGGAAAAFLSLGLAGGLAQAASPSPSPSPSTATGPSATHDSRADRRAVVAAVIESEADVLGIKPEELRKDLKAGQKVSDLAKAKGMDKAQFTARLIASLRPRLEQLVDHKQITQAQADRVIDRISKGHVPFWDGRHHKKQ
ncbi:MAG TPA: hypothetical protein VFO75_00725 [Candidatus Dormibacteraeota bacterium]|nr:hypothetical protein [Candidatus Dormibacteraeota bacterium]